MSICIVVVVVVVTTTTTNFCICHNYYVTYVAVETLINLSAFFIARRAKNFVFYPFSLATRMSLNVPALKFYKMGSLGTNQIFKYT